MVGVILPLAVQCGAVKRANRLAFIPHVLKERRAGVLLHITSLPQADLGQDAFNFVDFLSRIGATVWQTLPLNMTHADGSPYQCLSAHAGNPNLISFNIIKNQGWLSQNDLDSTDNKSILIALAYANFNRINAPKLHSDFIRFAKQQAHWLDDFCLFIVLRNHYQNACWHEWPTPIKLRDLSAIKQAQQNFSDEIALEKFKQFIFFKQWHELKDYANNKNIALFGDIPIFISYDSADVWAQPNMFKLDDDLNMTVVAGVPPDYFSETGQRWGNPHYNWPAMQADGFSWWLARMRTQNALFDVVRIDHFRGLEAAWEIPADEPTAINGAWELAPGEALLGAIIKHLPLISLVAEDLGIITDEVNELRENFDLPGMKILQFAFDGGSENPYLPEKITENSVVYTGTHDNNTSLGWYDELDESQKEIFNHYLKNHEYIKDDEVDMPLVLIQMALASNATLAIVPMQDVLGLGSAHRMNIPGTIEGNWEWRFDWSQLNDVMIESLERLIFQNKRNPLAFQG